MSLPFPGLITSYSPEKLFVFQNTAVKLNRFKKVGDQELTPYELHGAPVPAVTPFVGHSGKDPFHISSGCWDA